MKSSFMKVRLTLLINLQHGAKMSRKDGTLEKKKNAVCLSLYKTALY